VRILSALMLLVCIGAVWYFVRNDIADYAAFKLLTETAERQRRYRAWVLKSFLLFGGLTVVCLAIVGRLRGLRVLPPEFASLAQSIHAVLGNVPVPSGGFVVGFGAALLVGLIAGVLAVKVIKHKSKVVVAGDIEPLMPRNWQESAHVALLSLNAGFSEELFFRLLLPLLLTLLFGKPVLAFVVAGVTFGAIHAYQGAIGIAATSVLGFALTGLYLWTGNLWAAVCAHILLDMIGLVIRPAIARLFNAG
jgi:uncharacterized protein